MSYTDLEHDHEGDMGGRDLHDRRKGFRMTAIFTERDGDVTKTNGKGFQTRDGDWLNWSKFGDPDDVRMPAIGDTVKVQIDKAGFLRRLKVLAPERAAPVPVAPPAEAAPEHNSSVGTKKDAPAELPAFVDRIEQEARGTVVSRLACMNTATAILSSGGRAASPNDVLVLAAHLEAWATR
jgi:hypothetical protein